NEDVEMKESKNTVNNDIKLPLKPNISNHIGIDMDNFANNSSKYLSREKTPIIEEDDIDSEYEEIGNNNPEYLHCIFNIVRFCVTETVPIENLYNRAPLCVQYLHKDYIDKTICMLEYDPINQPNKQNQPIWYKNIPF